MERKPVLGIFLGEAAGIGPELVAKVVADGTVYKYCRPVLIGDARVLALGQEIAGVDFQWDVISGITDDIPLKLTGLREMYHYLI